MNMNDIIDGSSGSFRYRYSDVRSAIAERISLDMRDPEIDMFQPRNLRQMTFDELERFDPMRPMFYGFEGIDGDDVRR